MNRMSALGPDASTRHGSWGRRGLAAALAGLAVASVVVSGCGTKDDGGVITPGPATTIGPGSRSRSGAGGVPE